MLCSPRSFWRALCAMAGCLLVMFGLLTPAAAQSPPITITIDRVGYDLQGHVRSGGWFPVLVTVENQGADIQGTLVIRTDGTRSIVQQPVDLPGGSRKQITVLLRANLSQSTVLAQLVTGASRAGADPRRLIVHDTSEALVGVIGGPPGALAGLRPVGTSVTVVSFEPGLFPSSDAELAMFSVLALSGGELTPEQAAMLRRWVVAGGTLLLDGGPSALGLPEALQELAPGTLDASANAAAPALLSEVNTTRLTAPITLSARPLTVAPDAEAVLAAGATPLAASRRLGVGRVVLTAFDAASLPVDAGRGTVWGALLPLSTLTQWEPSFSSELVNGGSDLPKVSTLALLLLMYVLTVGPLNYLLLRRLDRREWAWATIPASVLVFMAITYIAGSGLRGGAITTSQVAVVDTAPGQPDGRLTGSVAFTAGRRGTWNTTFKAPAVVGPYNGNFFFGNSSNDDSVVQQNSDGSTLLPDWVANLGETRLVTAMGSAAVPYSVEARDLTVARGGGWTGGTITNRGQTTISRAYLVVGEHFIRLPSLEPGASYTVNPVEQGPGWPFVIEGGRDPIGESLMQMYSEANRFENGMLPANSIYQAPRLVVTDQNPIIQLEVDGGLTGPAVTIYNIYLPVEER
jgi:hypothetical protein